MPSGDARHLGEARIVRLHHHGNEGDGNAEANRARGLLVHERPVAGTALGVLLLPGRIVERELHIGERAQFIVVQDGGAVAVRGDGELDRPRSQVGQDFVELRVHAVFARAEIDRADGQRRDDRAHLFGAEPIDPRWIAVAERAREVALAGQAQTDREPVGGRRRTRRHRGVPVASTGRRAMRCR